MERAVRKFTTHAEADEADRHYYQSLTSQERMEIMLELVRRYQEGFGDESARRLKRVYRVVKLGER